MSASNSLKIPKFLSLEQVRAIKPNQTRYSILLIGSLMLLLLGVILLTACQSSNEALSGLPVAQREWLSCSENDRNAQGNGYNLYQAGRTEARYRLSGERRVRTMSGNDRCQGRNGALLENFCRGNELKSQLVQCRGCSNGACSRCGNGAVDAGETCSSCPADFRCGPTEACQNGVCVDFCGNGQPDEWETCANCPADAAINLADEPEICDSIDNDCDGQVDEGLDGCLRAIGYSCIGWQACSGGDFGSSCSDPTCATGICRVVHAANTRCAAGIGESCVAYGNTPHDDYCVTGNCVNGVCSPGEENDFCRQENNDNDCQAGFSCAQGACCQRTSPEPIINVCNGDVLTNTTDTTCGPVTYSDDCLRYGRSYRCDSNAPDGVPLPGGGRGVGPGCVRA